MDKIKKYQAAIIEAMNEYQGMFHLSSQNIHNRILADEKRHSYQFLWTGWKGEEHIFNVAFHIDILGGKVWIQQDNTEVGIANLLNQKGIPKSEIVLAYFPEAHRKHTEFAVA